MFIFEIVRSDLVVFLDGYKVLKHLRAEDTLSKRLAVYVFGFADVRKQLNPLDEPAPRVPTPAIRSILQVGVLDAHLKDVFPLQ